MKQTGCVSTLSYISREGKLSAYELLSPSYARRGCVEMCDLTHLYLNGVDLSTWFAEPGPTHPRGFYQVLIVFLLPSLL